MFKVRSAAKAAVALAKFREGVGSEWGCDFPKVAKGI